MQPLADAGYHVLAPDQRGYGRTDKPTPVESYDIVQLTGDLVGLLDHYGYENAVFVGHDWGALVVWAMAVLHPNRVAGVINLSVPFLDRGTVGMGRVSGRRCSATISTSCTSTASRVLPTRRSRRNPKNLLRNLYRTGQWNDPPPRRSCGPAWR